MNNKTDALVFYNGIIISLTFSGGLHTWCCIDSVTKQTVARHLETNNSSTHWTYMYTLSYRCIIYQLASNNKLIQYNICSLYTSMVCNV